MTTQWGLTRVPIGTPCTACGENDVLRTPVQWESVISCLSFVYDEDCCWSAYYKEIGWHLWGMVNAVAFSTDSAACCYFCYRQLELRVGQVRAFEEKKRTLQ